ncbi:MAG: bifunctional hydroxymethylpyrimidine kinase/phosphomethylpyrimidine kinase [Acidobacteria bacterium]|nr:bifunctional hydroxymethylpyrimidine kinase/phosphomethylpyrimidine kinase [Acidobacteriota bacterium]
MTPVALTIAGSDPSGGAGIQADLKTFHQFGVYGEAVITLLTVQNTQRVDAVECLTPELIVRQIEAVIPDIPPLACKTGALGNASIIEALSKVAGSFSFPLVIDPVMISKHGTPLMAEESRRVLAEKLIPCAWLLTPNLHEAEALTGLSVAGLEGMRAAAVRLRQMGARNVLVKGGHLAGDAVDLLLTEHGEWHTYRGQRHDTPHTHGTGCTYSAAITACVAKGMELADAVRVSKRFISEAIRTNPGLGHGAGPVNHHATVSSASAVL